MLELEGRKSGETEEDIAEISRRPWRKYGTITASCCSAGVMPRMSTQGLRFKILEEKSRIFEKFSQLEDSRANPMMVGKEIEDPNDRKDDRTRSN